MKRFPLVFSCFIATLLSVAVALIYPGTQTSAADVSNFKADYIISDATFTDYNSMSAASIQSFLNTKNSTCLRNFQTLSLVDQNGDGLGDEPYGKGTNEMVSAATLIWQAAQMYRINPKVILVTLEKEQGLITRADCPSWRYNTALGYGCPDGEPCDSSAYGFTRQIDYGVWHFRGFFDDTYPIPTKVMGQNYIAYNPDGSCGGTTVNIRNQATAALYSYTPYQPNAATLAAAPGQLVTCGAYGNLNFWRYFSDWFGSPTGPAYSGEFFDQSSHITVAPNQTEYVWIKVKNTGNNPWGDDISSPNHNPVHLATDASINRSSVFSGLWPLPNRPSVIFNRVYEANGVTPSSNQHVVEPGQVAEFKIPFTVSESVPPGVYKEHFSLIREGASDWWLGPLLWVNVTVLPSYRATYYSQSSYPLNLAQNEAKSVFFQYKNTGNEKWYDDTSATGSIPPVHLATTNPINKSSSLGASWINGSRPAVNFSAVYEADGSTLAQNQHIVEPGQIAKFEFNVSAMLGSTSSGEHILAVQPIVEGATKWDMGGFAWTKIDVLDSTISATYYNQSDWPTLTRGQESTLFFRYKNTGTSAWRGDTLNVRGVMPIHLATTSPINRTSNLGSTWINGNRPAVNFSAVYEADGSTLAQNQHIVEPGQIAKFEFSVKIPQNVSSGEYIESFQPIAEGAPGQRWQMGGNVFIKITVQ